MLAFARIEAVTGHGAVAHVNEMEAMVKGLAASLKCRVTDVPARLTALQGELKAVEQKAAELADKIAKAQVSDVDSQIRDIKGIKALVQQVSVDDIEALRNLGDQCVIRSAASLCWLRICRRQDQYSDYGYERCCR